MNQTSTVPLKEKPLQQARQSSESSSVPWTISAVLVWLAGIALRVIQSGSTRVGFDEALYHKYVVQLKTVGLGGYPDIVTIYIETQSKLPSSILPPMRFTYIFCGYLWSLLFGQEPMAALHQVAAFFSILSLTLAFFFALRMGGRAAGLGVLALVAFAPTQIHMSQHALVDGIFSFWALLTIWSLWEILRSPANRVWPGVYAASLAVMVMTKENSFFVFVAIIGILIANRWAKFGTITGGTLLVTFCAPAIGVLCLVTLAGGVNSFFTTYYLSVTKNYTLEYAILTGDGPWHRYLVDLLLVSPVVLLLAIGEVFQLRPTKKPQLYLVSFIGFSYLIMANIKYGMNLRYANMWDTPLRYLAFANLSSLSSYFGKRRQIVLIAAVVALCAYEFHQYQVLFVSGKLYELVTSGLMEALKILKRSVGP